MPSDASLGQGEGNRTFSQENGLRDRRLALAKCDRSDLGDGEISLPKLGGPLALWLGCMVPSLEAIGAEQAAVQANAMPRFRAGRAPSQRVFSASSAVALRQMAFACVSEELTSM